METIISSLISAGITLIVCVINNRSQQERTEELNRENIGLIEYKLDELTKRVDRHNNTIERTYHLEEQMTLTNEKIKVANHRIDDLERKVE